MTDGYFHSSLQIVVLDKAQKIHKRNKKQYLFQGTFKLATIKYII